MQLPDGDGVETVAFFQPSGDVADHFSALMAQKVRQKTDCQRMIP
jgi:hypothetical protein